jgi:4'-phosphopantetheinyl transferase
VACAIALDREVGVDVEDLDRNATDPGIVARYCTPREAEVVNAPTDGWRGRFLEYWTLKEAYLKARGLGIALPLSELGFARTTDGIRADFVGSLAGTDDRWAFHLTHITGRHLIAVAAPHHPTVLEAAPVIAPLPLSLLP